MYDSICTELKEHVLTLVNDGVLTLDNQDDWHHIAFNEDYYLIGYYNCDEWLKKHDVSSWDAISTVIEWERDTLGEVQLKPEDINAERVVNLLVYVLGEDVLDHNLVSEIEEMLEEGEDL